MTPRRELAGRAYQEALRLRRQLKRQTNVTVCPYDMAEEVGVEVRFVDVPSMEAMYVDDGDPKILIAADRPAGRQRFSCAHELGHHVFGHGSHISSLELAVGEPSGLSDEEFIAQSFAGFLLLPKAAVSTAFVTRGWELRGAIPEQFYIAAQNLGVSFDALVTHCERALLLLPRKMADALHGTDLARLRSRIAGVDISGQLAVLDRISSGAPTDLFVGDFLLTPPNTVAANDLLDNFATTPAGKVLCARRPGLSGVRIVTESTTRVVRISRSRFVGRSIFRHLEDPDHG